MKEKIQSHLIMIAVKEFAVRVLCILMEAHGPWQKNTVCQLHMRAYKDGDTIVVEPWRSKAFPVIKDLVVNRTAFDRIIRPEVIFQ